MKLELGLTNRDINARLFSSMFLRENAPDDGKGAEQRIQLEKLATDFVAMGLVAKTMTLQESQDPVLSCLFAARHPSCTFA